MGRQALVGNGGSGDRIHRTLRCRENQSCERVAWFPEADSWTGSESIRDNLLLANPEASDDEIINALTMAGCSSFIDDMPEGINTVLGRSGSTLSVGQQQRLCIARGLIRDAKILILDEPTAARDPESENLRFKSLDKISRDRLLIVITHRLSTVQRADRIVFLEDGMIKEQGSHAQLMSTADGHYRRYVGILGSESGTRVKPGNDR